MLRYPIITAITLCIWLSSAAFAQERYSIADISTQATGESATEARLAALEKAEQKAFTQLLAELLGDETHPDHYPSANASTISSMVSGYAIDQETVGRTSYSATLGIHFDQTSVDRFLNRSTATSGAHAAPTAAYEDHHQPSTATPSQPMRTLVLPLLRTGTGPMLWDDPNPWRQAWNSKSLQAHGVILPLGDLEDMRTVQTDAVATLNWRDIQTLQRRYPASRIVIADAALVQGDQQGSVKLTVTMHDSSYAVTPAPSFTLMAHEAKQPLFAQAMHQTINMLRGKRVATNSSMQLATGQQPRNLTSAATSSSQLKVLVPVSNIQQWIKMRRKLQASHDIQKVRVVAITSSQADIILLHHGSTDALQQSLQQRGMQLMQQDNFWVLRETI